MSILCQYIKINERFYHEKTVWKALFTFEFGAALTSFMLGIAWAISDPYDNFSAGIAFACAVGLLNAALLTVIVDKLPCKGDQEDQEI